MCLTLYTYVFSLWTYYSFFFALSYDQKFVFYEITANFWNNKEFERQSFNTLPVKIKQNMYPYSIYWCKIAKLTIKTIIESFKSWKQSSNLLNAKKWRLICSVLVWLFWNVWKNWQNIRWRVECILTGKLRGI